MTVIVCGPGFVDLNRVADQGRAVAREEVEVADDRRRAPAPRAALVEGRAEEAHAARQPDGQDDVRRGLVARVRDAGEEVDRAAEARVRRVLLEAGDEIDEAGRPAEIRRGRLGEGRREIGPVADDVEPGDGDERDGEPPVPRERVPGRDGEDRPARCREEEVARLDRVVVLLWEADHLDDEGGEGAEGDQPEQPETDVAGARLPRRMTRRAAGTASAARPPIASASPTRPRRLWLDIVTRASRLGGRTWT